MDRNYNSFLLSVVIVSVEVRESLVDRNFLAGGYICQNMSRFARASWIEIRVMHSNSCAARSRFARASWIEIRASLLYIGEYSVEVRESLVDRNYLTLELYHSWFASRFARASWIEIVDNQQGYGKATVEVRESLVDRNPPYAIFQQIRLSSRFARASWIEILAV